MILRFVFIVIKFLNLRYDLVSQIPKMASLLLEYIYKNIPYNWKITNAKLNIERIE